MSNLIICSACCSFLLANKELRMNDKRSIKKKKKGTEILKKNRSISFV